MANRWPVRQEPAAEDETRRLAAVRRYDVLDTPPDGSFDRITALAADLFAVPISIVSLVDQDRIWFKSHHGLDVQQIERAPGLCASAILQHEPWILTDAGLDPRALANPLVAGDFGLRFYVGVPLRTSDGFNLGTLCVIDREPRPVSEQQLRMLRHLATVVMDQMELRLAARRAIGELTQVVAVKERALQRSEILAKEIDHRVMNSLQLVSGLLRLQSRAAGGSEAGGQLGLAANRVSAIARVHQHIYPSEGIQHVNCKSYLQRLCADLAAMLPPDRQGALQVEGIEAEIPTVQIVPLGLIVNELVTNAIKYGEGTITVSLQERVPAGYALSVADEGSGLAAGFDPAVGSLGMKVISALVQQLRGQLVAGNVQGSGGARFTVLFAGMEERNPN